MEDLDQLMHDVEEKERMSSRSGDGGTATQTEQHAEAAVVQQTGGVQFDTFAALDLRVGRITDVANHPGARKPMYILKVDLGELGTRTIVAGIRSYYEPQDLIGKSIVVVANLEQRKIAGVLSEGMLLAAENGNDVVLLSPDRSIAPGSKIG